MAKRPNLNKNKALKNRKESFIILDVMFGLVCLYIGLLIGSTMNAYNNANVLSAFFNTMMDIKENPSYLIYMQFGPYTITGVMLMMFVFAMASMLLWIDDAKHQSDLRRAEKGSAQWNDDYKGFNNQFSEVNKFQTTLLSREVALSMNTRKTQRNNNVLIIGGSGAGKTRFFVKPNVLQTNCNMVITDPSGELLESTGTYLKQEGYAVKVFNLVEMYKSNCYNPFHYIRDDQGVIMMINCLIKNTTPPESHSSDPFWEKSETALLQALCFYLKDHRPVEEQNFATVMELLRWAEVDEKNPDYESKLDRIFLKSKQKTKPSPAKLGGMSVSSQTPEDAEFNKYLAQIHYTKADGQQCENTTFKSLEELDEQGTDIAVKQYKIFKMGAGKTAKSILISCAVRLTVFNLPQLAQLTGTDDIHLEDIGGTNKNAPKQALFVIIPAADSTFNFLVSMMYSQLFETLYFVAETSPECKSKRLPMHVKFLLDEFANIGTIPEFTKKLATMRKYEISCSVILQNLAQIKTMYKDDWESIVGNCDSMVFLGGKEYTTLEYISKELGEQTITVITHSYSTGGGKGKSGNMNKGTEKRPLMTPDELGNMDNTMCVVQVRGLDPFLTRKYDYLQHPRYQYTSDADPDKYGYKNTLNNMTKKSDEDVEFEAMQILDAQAKSVTQICSLEEMIQNNPYWADYPTIFKQFKTVPASPDDEDNVDDAIEAIVALPPISDNEPQGMHDLADTDTTTGISTLIKEYVENGTPASKTLTNILPATDFFDDEDEEDV